MNLHLHRSDRWIVAVASIVLTFPSAAMAYVDLGSGSVLVQSALGAIAVAATGLKFYWSRLATLFRRGARGKKQED